MVAGVESMQILYGEDTDGDGIVNHYVPVQLLTNLDNVISVKVSLIARSANAVTISSPTAKIYYHFGSSNQLYTDPTGTTGTTGTTVCVNPPSGNPQCTGAPQVVIPNDNRLRLPQPVSTEIAIRNFANCSSNY